MKPRFILRIVLAVLAVYVLWVGYRVLSFKPFLTPPAAPGQEIEGVYHVHSTLSDGHADVASIARKAAGAGIQFFVLADHGNPNRSSLASQGWKDGVLVLAGSELSVSRGHLVALDFAPPPAPFPQNADASILDVRGLGGFTIIAHPFSKVRWNWGGNEDEDPDGIEIVNGNTDVRRHLLKSLVWLPALLVRPRLALIRMLDSPTRCLAKWDELNLKGKGRVYGYFSADAHLFYGSLFGFARVHIFLKEPLSSDFETARSQVFEGLRSGKFYNAIDAAAQARGFRFWAAVGEQRIPMGSATLLTPSLTLEVRVPFDFPYEVRLIGNGRVIRTSSQSDTSLPVTAPGTYRVEVYLTGRTPLAKDTPWIVSNPIFVREEHP